MLNDKARRPGQPRSTQEQAKKEDENDYAQVGDLDELEADGARQALSDLGHGLLLRFEFLLGQICVSQFNQARRRESKHTESLKATSLCSRATSSLSAANSASRS